MLPTGPGHRFGKVGITTLDNLVDAHLLERASWIPKPV